MAMVVVAGWGFVVMVGLQYVGGVEGSIQLANL